MPAEDFLPLPRGIAVDVQKDIAKSAFQWWHVKHKQGLVRTTADAWVNTLMNEFEPLNSLAEDDAVKRHFAEHLVQFLLKEGIPSESRPGEKSVTSRPPDVSGKPPCPHFLRNQCRYGASCRFSHTIQEPLPPEARKEPDTKAAKPPPVPEEELLHPCIRTFTHCAFGSTCIFARLPRMACVHFLKGCCRRGAACSNRHMEWDEMTKAQQQDLQRRGLPRRNVGAAEAPQSSSGRAAADRSGCVGYSPPAVSQDQLYDQAVKWWRQRPTYLQRPDNESELRRLLLDEFPTLRRLEVSPEERKHWAGKLCRFLSEAVEPFSPPADSWRPPSPPPYQLAPRERRPRSPPPYQPSWEAEAAPERATDWAPAAAQAPDALPFPCVVCGKPYDTWAECLAHMHRRQHLPKELEALGEPKGEAVNSRKRPLFEGDGLEPLRRPRQRLPSPPAPSSRPTLQDAQQFLAQLFSRPRMAEEHSPSVEMPVMEGCAVMSTLPIASSSSSSSLPHATPAAMRFCPECGGALPQLTPLARFCMNCGASLLPYLT
eukprot:GGOE01041310.1.p1 GENE.GGOE01041310.1~~GGOE01041310.1.p1  ORF type:complete len:542 (+),score=57.44 GGOE01041310.1:53-1678(+)